MARASVTCRDGSAWSLHFDRAIVVLSAEEDQLVAKFFGTRTNEQASDTSQPESDRFLADQDDDPVAARIVGTHVLRGRGCHVKF